VEISGEHRFQAPRSAVWEALLDPQALQASMPGCERFEPTGPETYDITIKVGIAAIKGTYSGTVKVTDRNPQDSTGWPSPAPGSPAPSRATPP
jgi:carbon monoxide dehydrogenase subunit G